MLVSFTMLKDYSGRKRPGDVRAWCQSKGILTIDDADGHPVTTLDAVNNALQGVRPQTTPNFAPCPPSHRRSTKKPDVTTTSTGTNGTR